MRGLGSSTVAASFALAAFAVAITAGIGAGNDSAQILIRALVAMFLAYPVGLFIGMICSRIVREHVEAGLVTSIGSGEAQEPMDATSVEPDEDEEVLIV